MSIRIVSIIFVVSILILLVFQSVWLYNTYCLEEGRILSNSSIIFQESVKKELIIRLKELDEEQRNITIRNDAETVEDDKVITTVVALNVEESLGDAMPQYMLSHAGFNINLSVLDSLFSDKNIYKLNYLICYKDSTNYVLESIGNQSLENKSNVFVSDAIPIVNKNYVQLISEISVPVVLKQMIGLTVASFVMLFILIVALILQIRYTFHQYKLNRLREDFSQTLIHDLKTPLNTILITLSNYKNGAFDQNQEFKEKATSVAMEQVLNIQALVDKILTIARLEEKKMTVERTEVDLPALIRKLVEQYSFSSRKKVLFETVFNLGDSMIFADKVMLEQSISNLIDNAIKYSGTEVSICITCEVRDERLYVRVKDNGFGISVADQEKIFDKFERGGAVGRKGAKGFGLGLSYVRQVAIAHRGTVGISSTKGGGCEFIIMMPLLLKEIEK